LVNYVNWQIGTLANWHINTLVNNLYHLKQTTIVFIV